MCFFVAIYQVKTLSSIAEYVNFLMASNQNARNSVRIRTVESSAVITRPGW